MSLHDGQQGLLSWPARIAQQQGWEFIPPDFPRPILYDLEAEVRGLNTLTLSVQDFRFEGILGRIRDNYQAWLKNARESTFPCFDNLGLSGALIYDLYTRSAATSAAEIVALAALTLDNASDIHLAINGRFTLNPSQDPAFNTFTPIDWVRLRCPRRLLVQVGHNHGLYQIGSDAVTVSFEQPGGDTRHGDYFAQWQALATALADLPDWHLRVTHGHCCVVPESVRHRRQPLRNPTLHCDLPGLHIPEEKGDHGWRRCSRS
jgi:hypothetical protein